MDALAEEGKGAKASLADCAWQKPARPAGRPMFRKTDRTATISYDKSFNYVRLMTATVASSDHSAQVDMTEVEDK